MAIKEYTTEAKIELYLGESFTVSTVPTTDAITQMIEHAEKEIDEYTGTSFTTATATDELIDADGTNEVYTKYRPIIAVSACTVDEAGLGNDSSPNWVARTEGRTTSTDFVLYTDEGKLYFYTDVPSVGKQNVKITYTYGYAATPKHVEELATLLVTRMIVKARLADNVYSSQDNIQVGPISIGKSGTQSAATVMQLDEDIERLWRLIGKFKSHLIGW